jgi:thymidylate kinase
MLENSSSLVKIRGHRTSVSLKRGIWISIDGTEGVGKTILSKSLNRLIVPSTLAPEFSDSIVGNFLYNAVQTNPHIIGESILEQSLLFLADFFRIHQIIIQKGIKDNKIVISDRGYVSKYVYQFLLLSRFYDSSLAKSAIKSLFQLIHPPTLTILLTCDSQLQFNRLRKRDRNCDQQRIAFINEANNVFLNYLTDSGLEFVRIHQTNLTTKERVLKAAVKAIDNYISSL